MRKSSLVRFLAPSSSPALATEGLFELTRRPSVTRAVSLSSAETTEDPGCSQMTYFDSLQFWLLFHLTFEIRSNVARLRPAAFGSLVDFLLLESKEIVCTHGYIIQDQR